MWTSAGRYFSNAALSGALTDVWPATIAPIFVAGRDVSGIEHIRGNGHFTWSIFSNDAVDKFCLDGIDDVIRDPRHEVPVFEDMDTRNI